MMKWPDKLVLDIARRRSVLFFGAGISMNSVGANGTTRPKDWFTFLKSALPRLGRKNSKLRLDVSSLIDKNDLLTACEVIRRAIGKDDFEELIKSEFQTPGYRPADIHRAMWKLDTRITITPNFDNIYDSVVTELGDGTASIKTYYETDIAASLRRLERVLIKSHGSVSNPNQIIFSRTDYAQARNKYRDFYELLDSLLRTHTFLFIGCGVEDPDIRTLLEDYCYRHEFAPKHFFTISSDRLSKPVKNVLEDSLKLQFVEYEATKDHINLTKGLEELVELVQQKRDEIGPLQTW